MDEKAIEFLNMHLKAAELQMPARIQNIKKVTILWLFWHWGFLQGVFWEGGIKLEKFVVLRCKKIIWPVFFEFFKVYQGGVKKLNITEKKLDFEKGLEGLNDDFLMIYCEGLNNTNEQRASQNIETLQEMLDNVGDLNEVEKFSPILFVEEMVPMIGLRREDYLLIDLTLDDFCQGGEWRTFGGLKKNEEYVRKVVTYIESHFLVIQNQIEREQAELCSEQRPHIRALKILASVLAMVTTENNFERSYLELRESFHYVIIEFSKNWECVMDDGDLVEIFRIQLKDYIKGHSIMGIHRKNVSDLSEDSNVYYDEECIYFKREFLSKACKGELREIPFVRILRQMKDEGFLKDTHKNGKDLTAVVNLICRENSEYKTVRMVAIKRNFFVGMEDEWLK